MLDNTISATSTALLLNSRQSLRFTMDLHLAAVLLLGLVLEETDDHDSFSLFRCLPDTGAHKTRGLVHHLPYLQRLCSSQFPLGAGRGIQQHVWLSSTFGRGTSNAVFLQSAQQQKQQLNITNNNDITNNNTPNVPPHCISCGGRHCCLRGTGNDLHQEEHPSW
jgi:hypothetical protein